MLSDCDLGSKILAVYSLPNFRVSILKYSEKHLVILINEAHQALEGDKLDNLN